ncbi:hypothetical protein FQA39_LY02040 [Lamprigera yunnana]|nr:hypothetical protein FQA39_LY02040 [Lamprigera yunnana]
MRLLLVLSYLTIVTCYLTITEEKYAKTCMKDFLKSVGIETTIVHVYRNVFEDILPEKLKHPLSTIDIRKEIHPNSKYNIYKELFILNLKNASLIQEYFEVLEKKGLWNLKSSFRRRYLIVFPLKKAFELEDIFTYFFKFHIIDVIVMAHELNGDTKLITWDPYHPSNKCGTEFNMQIHSCGLFKLSANKTIQRFNKCNFTYFYNTNRQLDRTKTRTACTARFILDEVCKNINVTVIFKGSHYNNRFGSELYVHLNPLQIANKTHPVSWDDYMKPLFNETSLEYISVFLKEELLQELVVNHNVKMRVISDDTLLANQIMFGTKIGSHLIKPMRKIVTMSLEAGLLDFEASKFNRQMKRFQHKYKDESNSNSNSSNPKVLSLKHVYPIFVFWDILPEKLKHPLSTIDIRKEIHPNSKYNIYKELFILNLKNASLIQEYFEVLEKKGLWNLKSSFRRRYLIVFPLKKAFELEDIFTYFFKFHIIDVIVMAHELNGDTKLITWDPYHPSNKCGTEFNMQMHSCVFLPANLLQELIVTHNVKMRVISDDTLLRVDQIMFGIKIGSHLIKLIGKIVTISLEAGLLDFKASEFNRRMKRFEHKYKDVSNSNSNFSNPKVLSLKHVYPIFVFWGMGLTCATAVFIIEHIRHAMDKRSKKQT